VLQDLGNLDFPASGFLNVSPMAPSLTLTLLLLLLLSLPVHLPASFPNLQTMCRLNLTGLKSPLRHSHSVSKVSKRAFANLASNLHRGVGPPLGVGCVLQQRKPHNASEVQIYLWLISGLFVEVPSSSATPGIILGPTVWWTSTFQHEKRPYRQPRDRRRWSQHHTALHCTSHLHPSLWS